MAIYYTCNQTFLGFFAPFFQIMFECECKVIKKFVLEIEKWMHSLCLTDRANKWIGHHRWAHWKVTRILHSYKKFQKIEEIIVFRMACSKLEKNPLWLTKCFRGWALEDDTIMPCNPNAPNFELESQNKLHKWWILLLICCTKKVAKFR